MESPKTIERGKIRKQLLKDLIDEWLEMPYPKPPWKSWQDIRVRVAHRAAVWIDNATVDGIVEDMMPKFETTLGSDSTDADIWLEVIDMLRDRGIKPRGALVGLIVNMSRRHWAARVRAEAIEGVIR